MIPHIQFHRLKLEYFCQAQAVSRILKDRTSESKRSFFGFVPKKLVKSEIQVESRQLL